MGKLFCCISNQMGLPQLLLPSCLAGAVPQQHAATKTRGSLTPWLGMRAEPHSPPYPLRQPSPASPCWGHPGPAIPCASTTPSSLLPGEDRAGGDHRVSSNPESLLAAVYAKTQGSLSISCADLLCDTHRGARFIKYLSRSSPISKDGLICSLILG